MMANMEKLYKLEDDRLFKLLRAAHGDIYDIDYTYRRGSKVLLVAHFDTVHRTPPKKVKSYKGMSWTNGEGLGADDRNGVYAVSKLFQDFPFCGVLFTEEETGGTGITSWLEENWKELENYNWALEYDKEGFNGYTCYGFRVSPLEAVLEEMGLQRLWGSYTDISSLLYHGFPAVNLCNGGHDSHLATEYSSMDELEYMIELGRLLLEKYGECPMTVGGKDYQSHEPKRHATVLAMETDDGGMEGYMADIAAQTLPANVEDFTIFDDGQELLADLAWILSWHVEEVRLPREGCRRLTVDETKRLRNLLKNSKPYRRLYDAVNWAAGKGCQLVASTDGGIVLKNDAPAYTWTPGSSRNGKIYNKQITGKVAKVKKK